MNLIDFFHLYSALASTAESETEEKKVDGKKAPEDAPPVNIGWDSHKAVVSYLFKLLAKLFASTYRLVSNFIWPSL